MIIAADRITPTPWKNGGGLSRDLLAWPGAHDWRLRISLADVERDGPFSPYPGVERWFAVVEGEGVELQFGSELRAVRAGDAPLCFDGAAAPGCRLLGGATRDLNLMLQGGLRGVMRRGRRFDEDWPRRGRFDIATRTLHCDLPPGPQRADGESLWIGVSA